MIDNLSDDDKKALLLLAGWRDYSDGRNDRVAWYAPLEYRKDNYAVGAWNTFSGAWSLFTERTKDHTP